MKFAHIEMLFLIWIAPLLALVCVYGWRKRRRILNRYAGQRMLGFIVPPGLVRRRNAAAILALSAVICTVLALTGPQYGFQWQEIERKGIDIVIALDCSRSMLATDIRPTRLDRAKREILDLLNMLQGDRVGLVAFSGTAFLQCPLTIDYPAFYLFLDVLAPDYLPVGGTDLAAAVQSAQQAFDPQSRSDKAVILITDGEHTGSGDPMEMVREAQKSGIKLFTIGVGSGDGVPVPDENGGFKKDTAGQIILSRLDEALLSRMALATGGSYVRSVAGDIDLETIYLEQIRTRMEGAAIESGRRQIWVDRYQWPLTLGVLLLLLTRWIPPTSQTALFTLACMGIIFCSPAANAGPLKEGYQAYQKENYDAALKHFIDGQLQDPENPSLLYNLGNTYYKMKDFDSAEAHFRQALPKAPEALKPRLLYNLGNSAFRRGQMEDAIRNYEAALQLDPDDRQTKENLAFVKKQLQKQKQSGQSQKNQPSADKENPSKGKGEQQRRDKGTSPPQEGGQDQSPEQQHASGSNPPSREQQPPEQAQAPDKSEGRKEEADRNQAGKGDRDADLKAASQVLNRLKDQPGRAMMPNYRKRRVEKDW
ncbi:MAG: VWA domain-containing protein [Desulfobacteraceae bacterium]